VGLGRVILITVFLFLAAAAAWLFYSDDNAGRGDRRGGGVVSVVTHGVETREFTDIVEALGTSRASESVMLTSRVSDTVQRVNFSDGQTVKKGDLLVLLEDAEEQAQLREAQANLKEAESQFDRTRDLVTRGNASTSSLDAQRRNVDEARFRLVAAQARLNDLRILAPFDGVLGLRQISEGALINQSTPITTIDAIDVINLDFSVPERFIATMAPGQEVDAHVEAYPGRLFKGVVKTVASRVDPITRSVIVRAEVQNADHALRPGLLMTVQVISRIWQGLSIPEEAVVPSGGRNYVFLKVGDIAERREVQLGIRRPGYVEVTEGVQLGDRVVVEGTIRLGRSGIRLQESIDRSATDTAGDSK
jgi:membrane fusion protein (multidrug efflux system)